jgi:hypothetical protein
MALYLLNSIIIRKGSATMNRFYVFILRAILSVVFAVILSRIFFTDMNRMYVVALAVFLILAAYFSEVIRNRKSDNKKEGY